MNPVFTPCPWAKGATYLAYHDTEWGVPCFDSQKLFEKICLEGQQAGLSWITVLNKRAHYRSCFYHFNAQKIANMSDQVITEHLQDSGLIRNKLKLFAIRHNAKAFLLFEQSGQSFSDFIWSFVNHQPIINHYTNMHAVPAQTDTSVAMSRALKKAGFKFVGPTICYAFMQSMGLVNDHLTHCPCHPVNRSVDH